MSKIIDICEFHKKSKIKAGEGLSIGEYSFYTSSTTLNKYLNFYEIEKDGIVLGTGGNASIHYCSGKFSVSSDCLVIYSKYQKIDNEYLYYYLLNNIHILEQGFRGAGLKHITKKYIEDIDIMYIPDIKIQKKITNTINLVKNIIIKRKEQIESLDELVKSKFIEMFGNITINPNNYETYPIGDLCKAILGGGTPSKSHPEYYGGNIPWVTPKDMKSDKIESAQVYINEEGVKNSSTKIIPSNSLLMVIRSGILKRILPIAINTKEVTINQDMKAFVLKNNVNINYFYHAVKNIEKELLGNVRSVTADNIEFSIIRNYQMALPNIEEQEKFDAFVKQVDKLKFEMENSLKELEDNFNSLMQKAFKGELFS